MLQRNDSGPAVSVVVPVRNEAGNIAPLVAEIAAALAGRAFEILYVNDGSGDATEQELRMIRRRFPAASELCPAVRRNAFCLRPAGHVGFHKWKLRLGRKDRMP